MAIRIRPTTSLQGYRGVGTTESSSTLGADIIGGLGTVLLLGGIAAAIIAFAPRGGAPKSMRPNARRGRSRGRPKRAATAKAKGKTKTKAKKSRSKSRVVARSYKIVQGKRRRVTRVKLVSRSRQGAQWGAADRRAGRRPMYIKRKGRFYFYDEKARRYSWAKGEQSKRQAEAYLNAYRR